MCGLSLVCTVALAGCGDGASSVPEKRSVKPVDPLIGLTPERLNEFAETLRLVVVDPNEDAAAIAVARGWTITEWTTLYSRAQAIVEAGSFDAMLDEARKRLKQMESARAQYEHVVAADGPQAQNAERAIQALDGGLTSVRRTLESAELLRPGGKLIEARVSELEELMQ
jgi:hypothetical protein